MLIAAASRSLTDAESRYPGIELECLGITWACEKMNMYVMGLPFVIETDHKPLVPLLTTKQVDSLSPRLQRYRMRMQRYTYEVRHIAGKDNLLADILSRTATRKPSVDDVHEVQVCCMYENHAYMNLAASSPRVEQLRQAQDIDEVDPPTVSASRVWLLSLLFGWLMRLAELVILLWLAKFPAPFSAGSIAHLP